MFVIYIFEGRMRNNFFTMRVGSSNAILIATLRESSFIHAGPLRQKWVRSVGPILFIINVVIVCLNSTLFLANKKG